MKFKSYLFSISLLFSSVVFTEEVFLGQKEDLEFRDEVSQNYEAAETVDQKAELVQAVLANLTDEERNMIQEGFSEFAALLESNLKSSEKYMKMYNFLREKGVDVAFYINLIPAIVAEGNSQELSN